MRMFDEGFFLTRRFMDRATESYRPALDDPRMSPILADLPQGLAPAYLCTAGFDPLRDEGEAFAALLEKAGACAIIHSDSPIGVQHLNQEAAKAMAAARRMELDYDESVAIRWITINAAKALGVDHLTGSLEPGKMADLVVWDGNPFSVFTRAEKVFIDGALRYDRTDGVYPVTDFELGQRRVEP